MKISALKKMIHEEVRKAVRAELKAVLGGQVSEAAQPRKEEPSGLDEIRARFSSAQQSSTLSGIYDEIDGKKPAAVPKDKPANPKKILDNGEVYASGQNVLEWFKQSKDNQALREHEKALERMAETDKVVSNIIRGKGRI